MKRCMRVVVAIALLSTLSVCAIVISVEEWSYSKEMAALAGPISDKFPGIERSLKAYSEANNGRLPDPQGISTALIASGANGASSKLTVKRRKEQFDLRATNWEDSMGKGLLLYWDVRPYGPFWRSKYGIGLIIYERSGKVRYVKLFKLPDDASFSSSDVQPSRHSPTTNRDTHRNE